MNRARDVRVGCAGWSLSADHKPLFPESGTHLERYARVFSLAEINSSFYRPHLPATYARWAASVPEAFRFTAKLPREITHVLKLRNAQAALETFLAAVTRLGPNLGALLTQLPPTLAFEEKPARLFLEAFRKGYAGRIAWEARHPGWFTAEAEALLREYQVAAVAADPAVVATAAHPGGYAGFAYFRLHGSPRIYYSDYPPEFLERIAEEIRAFPGEVYCVFDNTARGAAVPNALTISSLLSSSVVSPHAASALPRSGWSD